MELLEGVRLMVIGMTTVIGFLVTLVVCMQLSALFFRWWEPATETETSPASPTPSTLSPELAAAIVIARHQQNLQRGA